MTASILETGAAHLMQLLTANHYEKYRNNMTSVSSQVLGDKSFILPLSSQMVHTQACFPEINICMKAKKIMNSYLMSSKWNVIFFFLHSGTSAVCVYPEEYSLLKRYILKGVFLPLCSPVSCISLIYVRRCEIETVNRRVWCILFIAFISMIRGGDWPKKGLWRLDFSSGVGLVCFPAASQMILLVLHCTVVILKEHLCSPPASQRSSFCLSIL